MSLRLAKAIILLTAGLALLGWGLSAIGALGGGGYGVGVSLLLLLLLAWWRRQPRTKFRIPRRRLSRPLPAIWLLLGALGILGGIAYDPSNCDTLGYRWPRVLQWLSVGRWHWVATMDVRQNYVGTGVEWVFAPMLAWRLPLRLFILPGTVAYLLLPGLHFSLLTRLGVTRRVAWTWMWLLSLGWVYLLQLGGVAADLPAAVLALAAFDFAVRVRRSGEWSSWAYAVIAMALLTNFRQTNLPLLLPWTILLLPRWRVPLERFARSAAVVVIALVVSCVPNTLANLSHVGVWTGWAAKDGISPLHPVAAVPINAVLNLVQNLEPPIFPWADRWNDWMHELQTGRLAPYADGYEDFGHLMRGINEQNAGLGLPQVLGLLLVALVWRRWRHLSGEFRWVFVGAWLALLAYFSRCGVWESARYLATYYPLLAASILAGPDLGLSRARWWRVGAVLIALSALPNLLLSRQRPLWPAVTVLGHLEARYPAKPSLAAARRTYEYNQLWPLGYERLRDRLSAEEKLVGVAIKVGSPEFDLWRPLGRRRVICLMPGDTPATLVARGVNYAVVDEPSAKKLGFADLTAMTTQWGASVIAETMTTFSPDSAGNRCVLFRLPPAVGPR